MYGILFLFEKEEEEYETIDISNVCRIAMTYDTQSSIRFKSHLKFFFRLLNLFI